MMETDIELKHTDADKTKILLLNRFTVTTARPIIVILAVNSSLTFNSGVIQSISNITAMRVKLEMN